ncbi:MAG: hypothetical protein IPJ79_02375 [Bacteroidetes bacterium]|nr:hypothetical protein [Bacteroidota bacterium]
MAVILLGSCGGNKSDSGSGKHDTMKTESQTPADEMATYHFTYTIANLPPPLQVLDEFAKSKMTVNVDLLNPVENADKYQTTLKQAFNYGIYGVDLGYLVVNNRTLDVIKYYGASKKLAEELNMAETFNRFVERFEANSNNKDTLSRVIDEAYAATDEYLRSNERLETASHVLAGSWLEAQYLTVNMLRNAERNADNEILFQRVWEQRLYLDNITKLLADFKPSADADKIKSDFEAMLAIYKEPADDKQVNKEFLEKLAAALEKTRANVIK